MKNFKFIDNFKALAFNEIIDLYKSVNWTTYTNNPTDLEKAFENSSYVYIVLTLDNKKILGLIRGITDQVAIHYIQDIIVKSEFQRKGIGKALLKKALDEHLDVRTHLLLTDNEEKQKLFYASLGFKNPVDLEKNKFNVYLKMKGIDLC